MKHPGVEHSIYIPARFPGITYELRDELVKRAGAASITPVKGSFQAQDATVFHEDILVVSVYETLHDYGIRAHVNRAMDAAVLVLFKMGEQGVLRTFGEKAWITEPGDIKPKVAIDIETMEQYG